VPAGVEQILCGRQVEAGECDSCEVVGAAEGHDPRDRERLRPVGQVDEHPVADGEVVLVRRRLVHHDVVGAGGCSALHQSVWRKLWVGVEREPERRAAAAPDRVAVVRHELGVAGNSAVHVRDSGQAPHSCRDRLRDRFAVGGGVDGRGVGVIEQRFATDLEADVLVGGANQVVESAVERVAKDQRPGHERHPEHDRQRGQRQAQLAGQQAPDRDPPHH
jgi:hypothetical protein